MDQEKVDKILKKIDAETWEKIIDSLKLELSEKKATNIATFQQHAYESGARQLALQLKLDVIRSLASDIKLSEDETANTKNSISKRLAEKVRDAGLEETLKGAKKDTLESVLEALGVEKEDTVKAQIAQLSDEIRSVGIALSFSKLKLSLLRDVCEELKIKSTPTSSNGQLVAAIVGEPLEKRERPPPAKITKHKPELVKGAAVDNINLHYTKPELEEFCTKNKISINITGKKREIAKKIVGWLNGEEEEERKPKRAKTEKKEKKEKKEPKEKKGKEGKAGKAKEKTKGPKGTKEVKETKETKEETTTSTSDPKGETTKKTPTPKSPKSTKRKNEDDEADKTKSPKKAKADAGDKFLNDHVFAIAGKFEGETHSALEREIKKLGGKVVDGILPETTHLLVPDIAGSSGKIQKAKESNVKVVALDFIRKSK